MDAKKGRKKKGKKPPSIPKKKPKKNSLSQPLPTPPGQKPVIANPKPTIANPKPTIANPKPTIPNKKPIPNPMAMPLPTPPRAEPKLETPPENLEQSTDPSYNPSETLYQKKLKIVNEIKSTETTYVKALKDLVEEYFNPLLSMAETELLLNISKKQIQDIFSNVEQLYPINKHLLSAISDRVDNWHEGQIVGDIFLKMAPFFKMYNTYGNNYEKCVEVLTQCQANEQFNEIIARIEKDLKQISLEGLLIQPIQRVPRYNLLLGDLLKKTEENHPDKKLIAQALATFENVMEYLDKNITEAENVKKFLAMSKFKGGSRLIQAHRVLITEGVLNIRTKSQQSQTGTIKKLGRYKHIKEVKLQIWLFNDVLVHLKSTKSKKRTNVASTEYTWPLELIWLKDVKEQDPSDPKMPYSFVLVGPRKTYTLRFPSLDEKLKWQKTIQSAVSKVLNEENAPDDLHRYGCYKFPKDGGEYDGWWKFGKIHGEGVFKFFGNKYTGEWEYNCKCGIGTFECVTGETYHGDWKEDKPHGYGQLHYTNRDYYDGEWKLGSRSGKGVLYFANGDKYDGEWRENVFFGEGTYTTVTGFIYNGGWNYGKTHGFGCLIAPNGRRYEGQFINGMKYGEGKLDYANGDFFIGQWKDDKRNGFGIFHSAVEGLYEGMFINGLKEGQGKMLFKNGDVFEGQFKKNLFHGQGTLISASGAIEKYDGQFEQGKFNGKGILFYRSGSRYEGQFKDDKPHGNGIYISSNAVVYDGKWENGRREGKAVIAVGPSKFSSNCHSNMMAEGERSFLVLPDIPTIHFEL